MYIKFCRNYGEDKKDEASKNLSPESKLSVELEGEKDKKTEGNLRLYRAVSVLLSILCLILLLAIIILSVKLQAGSTTCPEEKEPTSYEECHALFPDIESLNPECRQCADGWLTYGRSCFYLSTYRLSWEESQKNCTARGGSLAVVKSLTLQRFLIKKGRTIYWIGLRNKENNWTWVDNTLLKRSFWAEDGSEGDCGILRNGKSPEKNWIKASCSAASYFICQLQFLPSPSF